MKRTPAEILPLSLAEVARLEDLVAKLEGQKAEAETSDFGNPILAERLRGQILPEIRRNLNAANDRLRRIRDFHVPTVERALAESPSEKMSLCESQCFGESQNCVYCAY